MPRWKRLFGVLLAVAAVGGWALLRAPLPGVSRFIVISGSMSPSLNPGDQIAIDRRAADPQSGEIWTYYSPATAKNITHRIIDVLPTGVRLKGDANISPDPDIVAHDRLLGKVLYRVPYGGLPDDWVRRLLHGFGYAGSYVPWLTDLFIFFPWLVAGVMQALPRRRSVP